MKNKRNLLISSVIILIAVITVINFSTKSSSCRELDCLKFPGRESWTVKEVYENTDRTWRGIFTNEDSLVRVEKIAGVSEDNSNDLTNSRIMQVQGIFDKARSPYPGQLSDEIVCADKFKPIEKTFTSDSGMPMRTYRLYLNDRLVAGTCLDSEVKFESYSVIFYCPKEESWYQIDLIDKKENVKPEDSYRQQFAKIKC